MTAVRERLDTTPLLRHDGVLVKLECANPGGSIKHRTARFMLDEARDRGELRPGETIVEASSGNTGIALARAGRELGHPVLIFMPEHMGPERRSMMERLVAEVRLTPREEGFAGAVSRRDAWRRRPGFYVPDQFGNPDNVRAHRTKTGAELVEQLRELGVPRLDWFVAGVGTAGTLMGVSQALRAEMPGVSVAAVEPEAAEGRGAAPAGDHGLRGISGGYVPELLDLAAVDLVLRVGADEARQEAERLHRDHGFCVGLSSGANMVAARRLLGRSFQVATVWPDCSDRYASLGLRPPGEHETTCPFAPLCATRRHGMLPSNLQPLTSPGSEPPTP